MIELSQISIEPLLGNPDERMVFADYCLINEFIVPDGGFLSYYTVPTARQAYSGYNAEPVSRSAQHSELSCSGNNRNRARSTAGTFSSVYSHCDRRPE